MSETAPIAQVREAALKVCPSPVFILGAPRSGTSIVAWALAEHPRLWTPGEIKLFWLMYGKRQLETVYDRAHRDPSGGFVRRSKVTWPEFAESSAAGLNALLTSRSGGRRWIDHSPDNTKIADVLAAIFPSAQFIHVLRDGRSSVHSMVNFLQRYGGQPAWNEFAPAWSRDFESACKTWCKYALLAADFGLRHADRTVTIRYEDLDANPEDTLRDVLIFLGEPPLSAPAKYVRTFRINSSFQKDPRAKPARSGPRDVWDAWTPAERSTFTALAGDVLRGLCGVADAELRPTAAPDAG